LKGESIITTSHERHIIHADQTRVEILSRPRIDDSDTSRNWTPDFDA